MNQLLSFDPGPHCGVARWIWDDSGLLHPPVPARTIVGVTSRDMYAGIVAMFDDALWAVPASRTIVVCESFHSFASSVSVSQAARLTMRLCGWIEGQALMQDVQSFFWIQPVAKRPYAAHARTYPHDSEHSADALALGISWLAKHTSLFVRES